MKVLIIYCLLFFSINLPAQDAGRPAEFKLYQNFPNPFNPQTAIEFIVPQTSKISLKVFNLLGKEVAVLTDEIKQPGTYKVIFAAGEHGLSSGVYIYQLKTDSFTETKKMIFTK